MKNFEEWLLELKGDELWLEQAGRNHKPETFNKVAEQVYTLGISDRDNFSITPLKEHRNHVVNKLNKILPDKPKSKPWHEQALEKKIKEDVEKEEWIPLTGEARQQKLAEFKSIIDSLPMVNCMPKPSYKELAEEGGLLPKKGAPYPVTSPTEAYIKERHMEYIRQNYEPRTGQPLPGWISEHEFNLIYDL